MLIHSTEQVLLTLCDPRAILADPETRTQLRDELSPDFCLRFAHRIADLVEIPILPEWGAPLFERARRDDQAITLLKVIGDCLRAILINKGFDWKALLSSMLATNQLVIPQLENQP